MEKVKLSIGDAEVDEQLEAISLAIADYRERGLTLFASSSFQSHSIPMLHIISKLAPDTPIYFINTGFHFPETVAFRDEITELLGLNLVDLKSNVPKYLQRDKSGQFYFTSDPDYCCFLNKTQPMDSVTEQFDVWINGIRADQNANRSRMKPEQETPSGKKRYHPMLYWNSRMIHAYKKHFNLPSHPLEEKGYFSVGCEPCTEKFDLENGRDGRWSGQKKTECGLHMDLVK
jgi:phosphoadenosine phosphosulfate reductase